MCFRLLPRERSTVKKRSVSCPSSTTMTDDLPWPELGNVSRGATRGNQGSKGVLGPDDAQGCAVLQLRVQPGVLAVKLNPTATEWYRLLDGEVQRALKETKTYWRKARRRQDYDARADQDHMELHEWLQQLKDKAMAHLEILLQKGEIVGPPYVMPDHLEFAFMRGFIDRQRTNVPHNPRLRNVPRDEQHHIPPEDLAEDDEDARGSPESSASPLKSPVSVFTSSVRPSASASSPTWSPVRSGDLPHRIENSQHALRQARARLKLARTASHDAYIKYTQCADLERAAEVEAVRCEERLDELAVGPSQSSSSSSLTGPPSSLSTSGGYEHPALQHSHHMQHPHQQHQQNQQHPQHPQYTQNPHGYPWNAYTAHSPRPASSVSVSSSGGIGGTIGLDIAQTNDAQFSPDLPLGGARGEGRGEEWPGAEGDSGMSEGSMMRSALRTTSPARKHARDWEAQQHVQIAMRGDEIFETAQESTPRPPRKRMNQADVAPLAIHTSGAGPVPSHSPNPHPQQHPNVQLYQNPTVGSSTPSAGHPHVPSPWHGFAAVASFDQSTGDEEGPHTLGHGQGPG
ncbi:hypothetical protein DFH11DRAFT_1628887 [Phellopilus nigrolimitatus]|nr:hypothetical protein DFH11DRAFT_1628887 [Phellopilus nigrolimitatus]